MSVAADLAGRCRTRIDYGYFDGLGDHDFREGEYVKVTWPDDTICVDQVHLDHDIQTIAQEGREVTVPDVRAFLRIFHKGLPAKVMLRNSGLHLELIGIPP